MLLTSENNNVPAPRLCVLHIWPDFQGYGFNLHSKSGKPGQFIGTVEPNSPAQDAGLKEGDHIVEVNGASVEESSHAQVVTRIKAQPNTVSLLVVDPATEKYFKRRSIMVKSDIPNIKHMEARNKLAEMEPVAEIEEAAVVAAAVHFEPHVMKGKT